MRELDAGGLALRAAGRPGGRRLVAMLQLGDGPDVATSFEQALAALIPLAGLPEPLREQPLGPFRLDVFWPELLLCVEADSWRDHGHRGGFESDRARDVELHNRFGVLTLRFTYAKVTRASGWVIEQLALAAQRRSMNPTAPNTKTIWPKVAAVPVFFAPSA